MDVDTSVKVVAGVISLIALYLGVKKAKLDLEKSKIDLEKAKIELEITKQKAHPSPPSRKGKKTKR